MYGALLVMSWLTMLAPAVGASGMGAAAQEMGWQHDDHHGLVLDYSLTPTVAAVVAPDGASGAYVGACATLGARYVLWASNITTGESYVIEPMVGDHFGVDLNLTSLSGEDGWIGIAGLNPALGNILGDSTGTGRTQLSSVTEVFVPELGVAYQSATERASLALGWHFAARHLVTNRWAVHARVGLQILYLDDPLALASFGVGASFR